MKTWLSRERWALWLVQAYIRMRQRKQSEAFVRPMSEEISEPLILEDGDGDPSWLHERHLVEPVTRDWFSGKIGEWYGTALLFRVLGPNHEGELIALTPRTIGTIEGSLQSGGCASVIVHRFACDEEAMRSGASCKSSAIGMTVLRRADDPRWPD